LDRRFSPIFLIVGLLSLSSFWDFSCSSPASPPLNIVLILADDLGWKDLGFMGSSYCRTPNLDGLARQGMVFTQAYVTAPNCAPSRASLLTGLYTPRHGIYTVNNPDRGQSRQRKLIPTANRTQLEHNWTTEAEFLGSEGYVSASIGKWHLGELPEYGPCQQGFSLNVAGNHIGHAPAGYFAPFELPGIEDAAAGEYLPDRTTAEGARDPLLRTRPAGAVRSGNWKLIEYFENGDLELYDLESDLGERSNLATEYPEKTQELLDKLRTWRAELEAPVPALLNPEYQK
jgi:arylsulfatase A-like enzyme